MARQYTEERIELALPSPVKLFTPGVIGILCLMIAGYALLVHAPGFTVSSLALCPQKVLSGSLWQLISFSFINGGCGLAFNAFTILFIGSSIEREWRTRSFLGLWLVTSVVCAVIWILASLVMGRELVGIGSDPAVYGIIATFGLIFRRRRFWFFLWTVEAQVLAWIFIGIGLVLRISTPVTWIWVGGALVAYVYIKILWRLRQGGPAKKTVSKSRGFVEID